MKIYAYGNKVLDEIVDLCNDNVSELCPVQQGNVYASGVHAVPEKYTQYISEAAYMIPDLEGTITIDILNASNPSQNLGCFHSAISNGKSTESSGVKYATLGLAAAALVISAISSASNSGGGGAAGGAGGGPGPAPPVPHPLPTGAEGSGAAVPSGPGTNVAAGGWHPPGFVEFFSVMQGISISGMYSLNYPSAYRSFTQNMGWSTGIITWPGMQIGIDDFRKRTGGNLTASSYERLQNTTLVYRDADNANTTDIDVSSANSSSSNVKRMFVELFIRDDTNSTTNSTAASTSNSTSTETDSSEKKYVSIVTGIQAYVEKLTVPNTNTFMTLLIWWAIIVGICIAAILALKLFLEIWSIKGNKKNKFPGFRKRYWLFLASTLVRLVIIFYGLWTLYCIYQFKIGDAWGPMLLAGLLLGIMTIVLVGFTIRIAWLARVASTQKGGLEYLFKHKPWIRKYGLFYDQFKIKYWWCFIPTLLAAFGRNAFVALGYGNGLLQVIGQLVIDILLSLLFIFTMPFNTKMGNGINIAIQVVRVISLALLMTFAVQFNLNQIAATGIGMALIVIQAALTILLAILIMINAGVGIFTMACSGRRKKQKLKKQQLEEEEKRRRREEEGSIGTGSTVGNTRGSFDEKHPQALVVTGSISGSGASDDLTRLSAVDDYDRAFELHSLNAHQPASIHESRSSLNMTNQPPNNQFFNLQPEYSNDNKVNSKAQIRRVVSPDLSISNNGTTPITAQTPTTPTTPSINFSRPKPSSQLSSPVPPPVPASPEYPKDLTSRPSKRRLLDATSFDNGPISGSNGGVSPETTSLDSRGDIEMTRTNNLL